MGHGPTKSIEHWHAGQGVAPGFARLDAESFPVFEAGWVWLAGAGPGAPGLMSLLCYHALQSCDVVIYDALVNPDILRWVRIGADLEYAGKRGGKPSPTQKDITLRLIELARAGKRVLRLKGGDPFVLGRGGEELAACLAAGIDVEVVPGITSAVAVPGAAGIPVTHRGMATGFLVATAHGEDPGLVAHLAQIPPEITIVLLMGVRSLQMVVDVLLTQREPDTPAAIVERGWTPEQRTVSATLATVVQAASDAGVRAPSIVVIGAVAALHEQFGDVARLSDGAGLSAD